MHLPRPLARQIQLFSAVAIEIVKNGAPTRPRSGQRAGPDGIIRPETSPALSRHQAQDRDQRPCGDGCPDNDACALAVFGAESLRVLVSPRAGRVRMNVRRRWRRVRVPGTMIATTRTWLGPDIQHSARRRNGRGETRRSDWPVHPWWQPAHRRSAVEKIYPADSTVPIPISPSAVCPEVRGAAFEEIRVLLPVK